MHADDVTFTPDQEPYESGKIESSGLESVWAGFVTAFYCKKCKRLVGIDVDPSDISESVI